jgi:succinate-semialdehyde dehydrogenase/glutarate-semialdehyde dehydrogenase
MRASLNKSRRTTTEIQRLLADEGLFREQCYLDGEWRDADNGKRLVVDNPADGRPIGTVPNMAESETLCAIEAASAALPGWHALTAEERGDILHRWHELMLLHEEDLGRVMTLEQGKPLVEARGEIRYAAAFLKWFAEEGRRAYGDVIPAPRRGQHIVVIKQGVGVSAAITPWNFPSSMITRKAGAALAAGCTLISKPAEATPFSALALAVLAQRAGVPKGVFNVVTGDPDPIGRTFIESPVVRKLSFTGSVPVGRMLMERCGKHMKKVSLELGGSAPFIVFDDADIDAAVEGAMASKFRNTGQTCVCADRFFVQRGIHDAFVDRFAAAIGKLKVGDGFEAEVNQSALINRSAVEKVRAHLEDALERGAKIVLGGEPHPMGGNYVVPTLLTGVTPDMRICREETFGPLAGITPFDTEDEAIALANDTEYGLAAYFYTTDAHRTWRVAEALEAGIVGINEGIVSTPVAPFGGVKSSGLGREGSKYGLEEFLEIKYLCIG